jgi:putative Ca2+/H+ antiporter (TMEM165/GDT1 family)
MLTAFTAALLLITISELGDKTFFIAVILAMRHSRRWVFAGVVAALAAMTLISVMMGKVVGLLPETYIKYSEIALFLGFGIKLIYDASKISAQADEAIIDEAMEEVSESEAGNSFLARTIPKKSILGILLQSFVMTFAAEWGDRTQISTIALAAAYNPVGVTAGSILGHSICAVIAVIGGRLVAGHISEKMVTLIGGILFIIFGTFAIIKY